MRVSADATHMPQATYRRPRDAIFDAEEVNARLIAAEARRLFSMHSRHEASRREESTKGSHAAHAYSFLYATLDWRARFMPLAHGLDKPRERHAMPTSRFRRARRCCASPGYYRIATARGRRNIIAYAPPPFATPRSLFCFGQLSRAESSSRGAYDGQCWSAVTPFRKQQEQTEPQDNTHIHTQLLDAR